MIRSLSIKSLNMEDSPETWISLKDAPFRCSTFVSFRGTIIGITLKSQVMWGDGVYSYNVDDDKWDKYISYPKDFETINLSVSINKHSKEIYGLWFEDNDFIQQMNRIKIINLKKKQFSTKLLSNVNSPLECVSTVFINGKCHIFCGIKYKKHFILNDKFELKDCCSFDGYVGSCKPWAVMYSQNKRMMIFGGDIGSSATKCPLYCYEMKGKYVESKWKKIEINLPFECKRKDIDIRALSYCYHERSESVLIFDGLCGQRIYIVNINDFKVRESKIRCPENKIYDVVFVSHMLHNELIVMGYSRIFVEFDEVPHDIVNEIAQWLEGFDCVHLFDKNRGLCHWVIDVDSIIE